MATRGGRIEAWLLITAAWWAVLVSDQVQAQDRRGSTSPAPVPAAVQVRLPREAEELFKKGVEATKRRDWPAASGYYAQVIEKAPDFRLARLLLGTTLVLHGESSRGNKAIADALGANPSPQDLTLVAQQLDPTPERRSGGVSPLSQPYWARALEKAKALGYERSQDKDKLILVAMAALELDREPDFRTATANLIERFPGAMESHYFNGIRAARDKEWVTSEDELRRAGELGLPQETVNRILSGGLHSRASTWRYAYYTLYAGLAWVLGLGALFVVGKGLSIATLRSARSDDPNAAISPAQRTLRRIYRGVISFAGLYYYISLPFIAALAIAAALALVYAVFLLPRIPAKLLVLVLGFGFAMLMMIWSSIKSLFVRLKDEDPGRVLEESEAPRLWDLAREVAAKVGTRPVDVIYLTPGIELAVFERGRWLDKLRDRAKRSLILGQKVVDGFGLDPFRAVLAHEYGHFLHRDTAGGDVALRVNATMGRFAMAMIQQGNAQWWNIGWQFVRLYHLLFRRITHGASRLQEINADRVAARAYGKRSFEAGLRHVIKRDVAERYRAAMAEREAGVDAGAEAAQISNLFAPTPGGQAAEPRTNYLRAEVRRMIAGDVNRIWKAGTSEEDTHPSPVERIRLLERLRTDDNGPGEAPAARAPEQTLADMFGDPGQWQAQQAVRQAAEAKASGAARQAYFDNLLNQMNAYIAEHPGLATPIRDRGLVRMQMHDHVHAVEDFAEAIRLDAPEKAFCYYGRGTAHSKLGDLDQAAADLREAMRLDPSLESQKGDGRIELGDVLLRSGQIDLAIAEFTRAIELEPERLGIYLRRGDASYARGNLEAADADYSQALNHDPNCAEALIGRSLCRLSQGRNDEATADALAALAIEPPLLNMQPGLASLLHEMAPA